MKLTDRKSERLKRFLSLAALMLLMGASQAIPVFAEETAPPAAQTADNAAAPQRPDFKKWQANRQERRQTFLQNHPELKQKLDANGDGTVDQAEFKQGRETQTKERQEKREQKREAFLEKHPELKEKLDANKDGSIDRKEFQQARHERKERREERREHRDNGNRRDYDNNPPGMKDGPGTNWENRPGPAGGSGASPDRKGWGWKKK